MSVSSYFTHHREKREEKRNLEKNQTIKHFRNSYYRNVISIFVLYKIMRLCFCNYYKTETKKPFIQKSYIFSNLILVEKSKRSYFSLTCFLEVCYLVLKKRKISFKSCV